MARRRRLPPIIPCQLQDEVRQAVNDLAEDIVRGAHRISRQKLSRKELQELGLLHSAIERLRGQQSASMGVKRDFMRDILNHLLEVGEIEEWDFAGDGERHDYEVRFSDGYLSVIESKGCLDGNNTNIFLRPANADEFVIWSLCQNPASDPAHSAWSGIHTRLSGEVIHRRVVVDGVIIWDMLCGTMGRPCPKLQIAPERATQVADRTLPPPCLYLFPSQVPDPRNNPAPRVHRLSEVRLIQALYRAFNCDDEDVVSVQIEARMSGAELERRTRYHRSGEEIVASEWVALQRAR